MTFDKFVWGPPGGSSGARVRIDEYGRITLRAQNDFSETLLVLDKSTALDVAEALIEAAEQ